MAEVQLMIGGRPHNVGCRDGEEPRVRALGATLDRYWQTALKAAGGLNAERAMFFVALMLADKLDEAQNRPPAEGGMSDMALVSVAERLERLAETLEQTPATS